MVTPAGKPVPGSVPEGYEGSTPLMKQYFATCQEHPGIILLMRVGDFYEAYGEGAEIIARDLNITLTGREDGGVRVPMAGVPHHAMERYVARLIRKGRRIAIMDQVEDPKYAKGLVKRKVTRVVTPGTILEDNMLDAKSNNYLVAAVVGDPVAGVGHRGRFDGRVSDDGNRRRTARGIPAGRDHATGTGGNSGVCGRRPGTGGSDTRLLLRHDHAR